MNIQYRYRYQYAVRSLLTLVSLSTELVFDLAPTHQLLIHLCNYLTLTICKLEQSHLKMQSSTFTFLLLSVLVSTLLVDTTVDAWSMPESVTRVSQLNTQSPESLNASRRQWFQQAIAATSALATVAAISPLPASAATSASSLKDELKTCQSKLLEIPALLEQQEWDKVRTILKTPPVNKLWNLGDSQNVILQLAKETGDVELFEVKDELALALQMTDQLTYDNVFVYFQPGNGKVKIKEPVELANKAIGIIQKVLDE